MSVYHVNADWRSFINIMLFAVHLILVLIVGIIDKHSICHFISLALLLVVIYYGWFLNICIQRMMCFDPHLTTLKSALRCYCLIPIMWFPIYSVIFRFMIRKYRKFPDFYILGEQKCGTTSLSHYLTDTKLNRYFDAPMSLCNANVTRNKETLFTRGFMSDNAVNINLYKMFFPLKNLNSIILNWFENKSKSGLKHNKLCFDASPSCLCLPFIRDFIYKIHSSNNTLNKVKFIVLLREPISRFKSSVKNCCHVNQLFGSFGLKRNINCLAELSNILDENCDKSTKDEIIQNVIEFNLCKKYNTLFEKYKNNEPKTTIDWKNVAMIERCGLVTRGFYDRHIEWYFEKFDKNQFLFISINQLHPNQIRQTLIEICKFLNVYDKEYKLIINSKDFDCNQHLNKSGGDTIQLDSKTIKYLQGIYRPHNEKLFQLTGKRFVS